MSKAEKSPILVTLESQLPQERKPPTYGVVEIGISQEPPPQKWISGKGGMASTSAVAIAGIIVGIVLIFGLVQWSSPNPENNLVLKQENPVPADHVDITIPQGRLRGYVRNSREGREYAAFYKVPYAKPPLGKLRFKDPEPPTSWTGLRDESQVGPQCIQYEKYPTPPDAIYASGEEDCLCANIYVPNARSLRTTPTYPVMMYIHGGGISGNSSKYGAEYFMDEDVIMVMFNFRLGPLGNLNTGDDLARGNMGFKDNVQMLKWIRDNIASFGGDPQRVTVFGNSAGGMTTSMLMVSPMTDGLIHRAISQSGAVLCAPALGLTSSRPDNSIELAAKAHNCPSTSSTELIECLQSKPVDEIAIKREAVPYVLTVEDRPNPVHGSVFMPDKPYNLLKNGKSQPVPHIFGNVNAEAIGEALTFLEDHELINNLNTDFAKYGDEVVTVSGMTSPEMQSIKTFYFGEKAIGNETMLEFADLVGDKKFVHCSYETAKLHAKVGNTYLYWFTKVSAKTYLDKTHPDFPIEDYDLIYHGDEIQFQFPFKGYPEVTKDDEKYFEFSKYFVKQWVHFAATGEPVLNGTVWKKVDPDASENIVWVELGDKPNETTVIRERMQFWDQFSPEQLIYL